MADTIHRQCTLCEAHCGIKVEVDGGAVLRITGDPDDVISRGYICPKAAALADIQSDPDRLRRPVKKVAGRFVEIGWEEALTLAGEGLRGVQERHGTDALATYLGNPGAHSSGVFAAALVRRLLGTRNNYSATSTDQLPQFMSSFEMFGHYFVLPVPDVERTRHMLVIGANPAVSNGSLMTAPGIRDRIKAIRARGGKVVVIDPRRTETAKHASEHVAVRPGGDPYLLLGMLNVIFADGSETLGRLSGRCDGLGELKALAGEWTPERAAPHAGVEAPEIARLAREFAAARGAVAYARVGVCQQRTGSVTHWLVNALNVVTGNMDSPGGAMFPSPPVDLVRLLEIGTGKPHRDRFRQRVSGLPEFADELPVAGLADEITTPGAGQVRGMLVFAGNPVLSAPGGGRLDAAMEQLEWCVAVDMYVTETTRHADVILPPLAHLERSDIDIVFPALSVRNQVRYNPAALPAPPDGKDDWQILIALAGHIGRGARGRVTNALLRAIGPHYTFERVVNLAMLAGPYGRLRSRRGLSVGKVKRAPHGIDLGPLESSLIERLRTKDRRVRLAPPVMLAEGRRLQELAGEREAQLRDGFDLTLIGRRSLRSNNSWMHNSRRLIKGADRCTALMHPDDAAGRGLSAAQLVRVSSTVGSIELPLEVSDEIRPGVVSIPHGFGHGREGVGWRTAAAHAGVSVNDITDPAIVDRLTGNAAYNDVAVRVEAAAPASLEAITDRALRPTETAAAR
ncbi:MAG TPA: molybdopterin-dependent oxidoreductase [Solirubrobacteraceae bacterium]|nr:molybdopterin-dependent oxidoreductase [Solirubrobacteraceae bacterium]